MTARNQRKAPLIIAFVADLMFTTKIANVANHLGYRVEWIEQAADLGDVDPDAPPELPGELLHGREGRLFQQLAQWQPALLLFDLNNKQIPWESWIIALKSSPATRRMPILCFGPHEDVATMTRAKAIGADAVVARSRFTAGMPKLFQQVARIPDYAALVETCREPLPELVIEGIELFNAGEYYKCHDSLEEAWMNEAGPIRDLYRAILQVGIAYYQIERGNYRGALKLLLRVQQWLAPLPDRCRGVNVARLHQDVRAVHDALVELGPERLDELDRSLLQPLSYTS
jgi:predicted metal-dependent hydrolase